MFMVKDLGGAPPDFAELLAAFEENLSVTYLIGSNSEGSIGIEGGRKSIRILWPDEGSSRALSKFKHLNVSNVIQQSQGQKMVALDIDAKRNPLAALTFATFVISQLTESTSMARHVANAVREWSNLIEEFDLMSKPKVVGLIGELLFLNHLGKIFKPAEALKAWLGPPRGEHDFSLPHFEVEVKTTESERRRHYISSETQLVASPGRPLYLLSIQLTGAGSARRGFSLSELVDVTRQTFRKHSDKVDERLQEVGWDERFSSFYDVKYQLRSSPELFLVDEKFPAITRELLDANIEKGQLVSAVSYKIDLTAVTPTDPIAETIDFGRRHG